MRVKAEAIRKFEQIDTDGSGTIDIKEVTAGASILGMEVTTARQWFFELDTKRDGEVPIADFVAR